MDGHLPSLGWSPTNLRMVTHLKEVFTHQRGACYRLEIWHLGLTHNIRTQ